MSNTDHVSTHSSPTSPSFHQGIERHTELLKKHDAPQKARVEKAPKLNTSFHLSLSSVIDAIMDTSGLIGQNGDKLYPFILELVDQQNNSC